MLKKAIIYLFCKCIRHIFTFEILLTLTLFFLIGNVFGREVRQCGGFIESNMHLECQDARGSSERFWWN